MKNPASPLAGQLVTIEHNEVGGGEAFAFEAMVLPAPDSFSSVSIPRTRTIAPPTPESLGIGSALMHHWRSAPARSFQSS